jgi:enoyl-CoA hydratase/carnithine racemase
MSSDIRAHLDERVLVVTLDRPAKRNAITAEMYAAMARAIERARLEDEVNVVLLRGEGGNFTSGNDIGLFVSSDGAAHAESPAAPFLRAVLSLGKPMVACVRGHAVGIGATVLLHCDYVVASDDARLRFPFVDLGLCPEFASTLLLQRVVGRTKAAEWLLLGSQVPAAEAFLAGLVNRVMPPELAEEEALSIAKRLAAKPQQALRATRALIRDADDESAAARIRRESAVFDGLRRSDEAQDIFKRFLGRQPEAIAARA